MMNDSYDNPDFMKLIRQEKNARMRLKLLALLHFHEGKSRYQISDYLKVSRTSVNKWVSNYLTHGLEGLKDKKHSGRPAALTAEQLKQLSVYIKHRSTANGKEKLHGSEIQSYISDNFGVSYEISNIYKILERLGYAWVTHA
ncbi:helix-turn-helix domain-containing protein [Shewanella psychropiezotolerans]|uniref:Helix-turn-helix domain-containing protein n=1 Tax=Shewanella psychropiezotolerans TaxID=2593655 RepID=A0ABX5WXY3_9GAMM|nr:MULTISPECIES: helix-turn-helix domain-containing protein [Shewanella]MPY24610.1 helix-turn-helix domain-containing protein [Shewanella sp. YLB-07]QDO83966.1 helix-turn-helix domain-containing protein [Shewanella psychropiezotolerans]